MSRHRARLAALALPVALVSLAACGSDDDSSADTAAATTAAPVSSAAGTTAATASTAAATSAADGTAAASGAGGYDAGGYGSGGATTGGAASVGLADTDLGTILVDGEGMTLYLFTEDTEGTSVCSGECLAKWPPLSSDSIPTVGEGLDAADFSLITGTDGEQQVAFHGHPLYYWFEDVQPGDMNGQGVGDVWFVVDAQGNAVRGDAGGAPGAAPAASTTPAASSVSVSLADTSLGKILTDGEGRTLYLFTKDTDGTSACVDECLANWPPLRSDVLPQVGEGLDAGEFSLITGSDGNPQVAYHGHPLYRFAVDTKPGDVTGQGVGDVWFAVGADGDAVDS